jgi:hypothetical protein
MLAGTLVLGITIGSMTTALILPVVQSRETPARQKNEATTPTPLARADTPPKATPAAGNPSPERLAQAEPPAIPPGLPPGPMNIPPAPQPALNGEKPDPDEILRKKGLKRSGPVYILDDEALFEQKLAGLTRVCEEYQGLLLAINQGLIFMSQKQEELLALERQAQPGRPVLVPVREDFPMPVLEQPRAETASDPATASHPVTTSATAQRGKTSKEEKKHDSKEEKKHDSKDRAKEPGQHDPTEESTYTQTQNPSSLTNPALTANPFGFSYGNGMPVGLAPPYINQVGPNNLVHPNVGTPKSSHRQNPVSDPYYRGQQPPSGFNQGEPMLPGFNQGQPMLPGFNQGQPMLPGFNQGQPMLPGFNQGQRQSGPSVAPSTPSQPSHSPAPSPAAPHGQTSSPRRLNVLLPQMFGAQARGGLDARRVLLHYTIADGLIVLNKLEMQAAMKEAEFRRRQAELSSLADDLKRQYDDLWKDPGVLAALEQINPKVTLGPRPDYRKNLERMTTEVLEQQGVHRKNKGGIFSVAYVATLEQRVRKSEEELKKALTHQEGQKREARQLAAYYEQAASEAVKKNDQKRIAEVQKKQGDRKAALTKSARSVAAWREAYVQSVAALRKACEEAPQKIEEWKKKHPDIQIEPLSPSVKLLLDRAEASMTTSEIRLETDGAVNLVQAILDTKALTMILKPDVDLVRLSTSSAEALGITPGADAGVPEEVVMEDGQKLPARRVTLKSVQVGQFTAEDLECLVFLKGYETDPILGAGFLNQFTYRIDPEAGKLFLTRVDVKSSSKPGLLDGLDRKKPGSPKPGR